MQYWKFKELLVILEFGSLEFYDFGILTNLLLLLDLLFCF